MSTTTMARALCEQLINGTLDETTVTSETHYLRLPTRWLTLDRGPVTAVTTVTVDGTAVTAGDADGFTKTPFALARKAPYEWPAGVNIVTTYVVGWAAGSEPEEVQEALAALETWLGTKPEVGFDEVRVGDAWARIRPGTTVGRAPDTIRALLRKWVRHVV